MFNRYFCLVVSTTLCALAFHAPDTSAQSRRAYSPVPTLNKLYAFQQKHGTVSYASGFGLTRFDDDTPLEAGWSRDPAFLGSLYPFARATGNGSFYAIWRIHPGDNLSRSPIVLFGGDGSEYVVAQNVEELLSLVMVDSEPTVDDDDLAAFVRPGSGYRASPAFPAYSEWVEDSYPVVVNRAPDVIVKRAQVRYGPAFKKWKKRYVKRKR